MKLRFQLTFLAAILFHSLQSVTIPTIISAAEQEPSRRHSLIHRSGDESATLPATTQEAVLQPSGTESTHSVRPMGSPKNAFTQQTMPTPHHRTFIKRPAVASVTAPATPPPAPNAAPSSGAAAGQATQTTAAPLSDTTPAATVPTTKAAVAPLPGVTTTGSVGGTSTASSPFAASASVPSVASARSGSTFSSGGSRSALNLIQSSAIANLLQPPPPVVTAPPSVQPPSTSPSTQPPPSPSTGNATLTWTANREPDLAGYRIYVGTASGTYSFPGSAFVAGNVTSYTISNLPIGQTYFFAISAYDSAGNESPLSAEVSKSLY